MRKFFILSFCCLWAIAGIAQSNKFDEWKQKSLAKSRSWSNFTREATVAHNRIYYSLYIDRQFVASFANVSNCNAKKQELRRLAEQIFNSNTTKESSNYRSSAKVRQGLRELSGMSDAEIDQMNKQLESKRDEAVNKQKAEENKKLLADIDKSCDCRTETNQNYDPDAKPYDFGNNDLISDRDKTEPNLNTMLFGDAQTQYDNVFDALAATKAGATTTAVTGIPPATNFDFDEMEKYVSKSSNEIYVDNTNWKGPISQPPIYLGDSTKERMAKYDEYMNSLDGQLERLQKAKNVLEQELADIMENCRYNKSDFACEIQSKPVIEQLDILEAREARIEWLKTLDNMSEKDLKLQERYYKTLVDMGDMAAYAYAEKKELSENSNWKKCENTTLNNIIEEENNKLAGFHCEILQSKENTEKYVIAFRGTEPPEQELYEKIKDYGADVLGALVPESQTEAAYRIIEQLQKNNVDIKNITVTGHSLGGRLAAEVAIKYGVTAYTFNAADVSAKTKILMDDKGRENSYNIINTTSRKDFLSELHAGLRNSEGGVNTTGVFYGFGHKHYSTGHTNILKDADGGHSIFLLNQSIEQRYNDILLTQLNKRK